MEPPKPLQINALQALQITDTVLGQMLAWIETKVTEPQGHKEKALTAKRSLFHARMLLGVRHRELVNEAIKAQKQARPLLQRPLPTIDEGLIDKGRGY